MKRPHIGIGDPKRLLGVISGMIVWAVWFVLVYALTGIGCRARWNLTLLPPGNLLSLVMLLTTLLAVGLIGACVRRGHAEWRAGELAGGETGQRRRFMGLTMMLLSVLAGIGTLLVAIPVLMLDPCAG